MTSLSIDVWLDFSSLSSYIGLNSLRRALSSWDHAEESEVRLHPFFGDTNLMSLPESVDPAEQGISLGTVVKIEDHAHDAQCLVAGVSFIDTGTDTLALRTAEAILRSRFEMGLDITDEEVLLGIAQDMGVPAKEALTIIHDPSISALVDEAYSMGLHLGITSTPVYLFDESLMAEGPLSQREFTGVLDTAWQQHVSGEE